MDAAEENRLGVAAIEVVSELSTEARALVARSGGEYVVTVPMWLTYMALCRLKLRMREAMELGEPWQ